MAGAGLPSGNTFGVEIDVSEMASLTDGHIIIGDGSGAPTTRAAFASSTGAFTPGANGINFGAAVLLEDAANTLALRNGTTGQVFRIYNTFTSSTNHEKFSVEWGGNVCYLFTDNGSGGGTDRAIVVRSATTLGLETDNGNKGWDITTAGHVTARVDNTYDIGVSGATRPRTGYFGTSVVVQGANGQAATIQHATSSATVAAGAAHTFTNLIPAGATVLGVTVTVTTTIGTGDGATGFSVGDGSDVDRWASNFSLTAGAGTTGTNFTISQIPHYAAATSIVLTAVAGTFDGTGVARVTVAYINLTAATS